MSFEAFSLADLSLLAVLAAYFGLAVFDRFWPARRFEGVRYWRLEGGGFFLLYLLISSVMPFIWDGYLAEHRVLDLTGLGFGWQVTLAVLVVEVGVYCWHRALHRVPASWRWFHQMHHSAERVEIWGAVHLHPFDVVGSAFVGSLGLVWLAGVTPEAALVVNTVVCCLSTARHANIKTPHWLGYIVARPRVSTRARRAACSTRSPDATSTATPRPRSSNRRRSEPLIGEGDESRRSSRYAERRRTVEDRPKLGL